MKLSLRNKFKNPCTLLKFEIFKGTVYYKAELGLFSVSKMRPLVQEVIVASPVVQIGRCPMKDFDIIIPLIPLSLCRLRGFNTTTLEPSFWCRKYREIQ